MVLEFAAAVAGWTFGLLYFARIARWLMFVRAMAGKPTGREFAVSTNPRPWKTAAAIVLYPTPWIALVLLALAVRHFVVGPVSREWEWFYGGFLGGPAMTYVLTYVYVARRRAKAVKQP